MAINSRGEVKTYTYFDDAGKSWSVHLTSEVATAGGFVETTGSEAGFSGKWPHSQRKLRHIQLKRVDSGKVLYDRLPVAKLTGAGGTASENYALTTLDVNLDGHAWKVISRHGEHKKL